MSNLTTRQRILEASRQLFNERGYAGTTLAQIAAAVGIAEGNLWYHFRTKADLVSALSEAVRGRVRDRIASTSREGSLAENYIELIHEAMRDHWDFRFLLRDYRQLEGVTGPIRGDSEMTAQFSHLQDLLTRMKKEQMLRRDVRVDLKTLARSLWIVSRYWSDHLHEQEGLDQISWADQERGFQQHLTLLAPYLTASAQRQIETAAAEATRSW